MKTNIKIEQVKISALKPADYNPRILTDKEKEDLKNSIEKFGFVDPIIVNSAQGRENIIIGGHQRFYVAQQLGMEEVPVVYIKIESEEEEKELNLRLNRNTGKFDYALLLGTFEPEFLKDIGFEEWELKSFESESFEGLENIDLKGEMGQDGDYLIISFQAEEIEEAKKLREKFNLGKKMRTITYQQLKEQCQNL